MSCWCRPTVRRSSIHGCLSGTALGKMSNIEDLRSAIEAKRVQASGIFYGATAKQWVFNLTMPLPEDLSARW